MKAHVPEPYRYYLLHQRGYAQRFDWVGPDREPEELFSATKAILIAKDQKLVRARAEIQCAGFGKIIVLVHCDEPDLHSQPAFCRKVFASQDFQPLTEIDEAFLLLPCPRKKNLHDFEAEYCQPIRIPIPPKISAV